MAETLISTVLRLSPEEQAMLRRLVGARLMETGQRVSQNDVLRDLIRKASADAEA